MKKFIFSFLSLIAIFSAFTACVSDTGVSDATTVRGRLLFYEDNATASNNKNYYVLAQRAITDGSITLIDSGVCTGTTSISYEGEVNSGNYYIFAVVDINNAGSYSDVTSGTDLLAYSSVISNSPQEITVEPGVPLTTDIRMIVYNPE